MWQDSDDVDSSLPAKLLDKIERSKGLDKCKEANRQRLQAHIQAAKRREKELAKREKAKEVVKTGLDARETDKEESGTSVMTSLGMALINELQKEKEEDPFTLFCLSLAPRLRALPRTVGRQLMMHLFQQVFSFESKEEENIDDSTPDDLHDSENFTAPDFSPEEQVSLTSFYVRFANVAYIITAA